MSTNYKPPYSLTPTILNTVAEIAELVGRYTSTHETAFTPTLRRGNRIRTIQASLAIENNSLTLEQVTAVLDGKRVIGLPREIQEVRNAFAAYEKIESWNPASRKDLLDAHGLLTAGLVDDAGKFRSSSVGIFQGKKLIHMAPPADRVHFLMDDLLSWLKKTPEHPIVASCIFHYEFEFIHPFSDGNGRLGRLWQTLILSKWKPLWAYLPVETIIAEKQNQYYSQLGKADAEGDATSFVEFMIKILKEAIISSTSMAPISAETKTELVEGPVNRAQLGAQSKSILLALTNGPLSSADLSAALGLQTKSGALKRTIKELLALKQIEYTIPDKPNSRLQKYRLVKGLSQ